MAARHQSALNSARSTYVRYLVNIHYKLSSLNYLIIQVSNSNDIQGYLSMLWSSGAVCFVFVYLARPFPEVSKGGSSLPHKARSG